ncbi:MAG: hypothetical protein LBC75_10470, partial [Fibromonadaceae bacterium]|nr:hypothetical protein [Fibromonadaceae bacterium]
MKTNHFLSFAAMLCISLLFSCTEVQRDNPDDEKSINYKGSSFSLKSSSSSSVRVSSSSSTSSSSSSVKVSSSSSMSSSSSSPYRLVCEVVVDTGIADEPIYEYDMPEVICIENKSKDEFILEPEYDFQWVNAPNWDAPKAGTYSKIQVKVNNDAEVCRGLTATCSGTLTILKGSSSSVVPSSSSSSSIQINIVYGDPVNYEGETYKTVVIGTQTWFQRNLNYDVAGSKCNENSTANCNEYGRLYN